MPKGIERMRRKVRVGSLAHPSLTFTGSRDPTSSHHIPKINFKNGTDSVNSSTTNLRGAAMEERPYDEEELDEYRQLFDLFDEDRSGAIGNEELKKAILNFGHQATDAEIDELIEEVKFFEKNIIIDFVG